ncbi:MAG: hypothetical protein H8E26_10345 [FCB group bacterium]|nr:hypothetical protein [FCB group bacterium]MBL7120941.1 hypothetical protein [Candidatus Neomarinimicrobiota bacterium]
MKLRLCFLALILIPQVLNAQIPDVKIPYSIKQYFKLNRVSPELVCVDLFDHPETGRTIRVKIVSRRNETAKDLAIAFAAAAAVANMAEPDIELLWVEMEVNFKDNEITMALAPAKCTIDALIINCETERWWQDCLEFP